jgi:DNA-binding transcriptional MocR family regulator
VKARLARPVGQSPLYEQLARDIAEMIRNGVFRSGDRLPSVRALKASRGVSAPTAIEAFRWLEDHGLVEARSRSGYFVMTPRPDLFAPRLVQTTGRPAAVETLKANTPILCVSSRPDLLPFGAAVPSAELFPLARLRQLTSSIVRRHPEALGTYTFSPGLRDLRFEIARRAVAWGYSPDPDDIVITNGCVEAVGLALRAVTKPGDIVAIESPGYYGFIHLLEMLHLKALEIPSNALGGLSLPHLREAISRHDIRACLISTTVTNPSGATMTLDAKQELVALLADSDIPLIEDATFADLHFRLEMRAAKSLDQHAGVMLCASLTKTVAPGLRLGWIDAGRWTQEVSAYKRVASIGQPELPQRVLAAYLAGGGMERHLRALRRRLAAQVDQHLSTIAQCLGDKVRVVRPTGGFLLWLELPAHLDGVALQAQAADLGIGLAPGRMFSVSGGFRNYLRVNCGQVWSSRIETAYLQLSRMIME